MSKWICKCGAINPAGSTACHDCDFSATKVFMEYYSDNDTIKTSEVLDIKPIIKLCSKYFPYECFKCGFFVKFPMQDVFACYISSGLVKPSRYDLAFINKVLTEHAKGVKIEQ